MRTNSTQDQTYGLVDISCICFLHGANHFFRRGIHRVERLPGSRVDKLVVDEQTRLNLVELHGLEDQCIYEALK